MRDHRHSPRPQPSIGSVVIAASLALAPGCDAATPRESSADATVDARGRDVPAPQDASDGALTGDAIGDSAMERGAAYTTALADVRRAFCGQVFRCDRFPWTATLRALLRDAPRCERYLSADVAATRALDALSREAPWLDLTDSPATLRRVREGLRRLDREALARCLAALDTSCPSLRSPPLARASSDEEELGAAGVDFAPPGACDAMLRGVQPSGARCSGSVECVNGLRCELDPMNPSAVAACEGVCRPLPARGARCESACASTDGERVVCAAPCERCSRTCGAIRRSVEAPLGAYCGFGGSADPVVVTPCAEGLQCRLGVCTRAADIGGPCRADSSDCRPGLVCDRDRCIEPRFTVEAGGPCGDAGGACSPLERLACVGDRCVASRVVGAGEPCDELVRRCPGEMTCLCTTVGPCSEGVCGTFPGVGEPCRLGRFCDPRTQAWCDETSTCRAPSGDGEPCSIARPCGSGLHCGAEGRCVADPLPGSRCMTADECGSGRCVGSLGVCVSSQCQWYWSEAR